MEAEMEPDDALLAELAEALRPWTVPPPEVVEAGKQSFTWRTIDAELAVLTHDSLLDATPVLARSGTQPRMLTFEAGELTIELEVDSGAGQRRLVGQLLPGWPAELELRAGDAEPVTGRSDGLGRFSLPLPAERRRVGLRLRLADGTDVELAPTEM
jgi:hypothetical protein